MAVQSIICPRCKKMTPPGTAYCPRCGEALDPKITAELQWLVTILRDLDTLIAGDQGDKTVADLHEEYYTRYQELRRAPWLRDAEATRPAPASSTTATTSEGIPPEPDAALPPETPAAPPLVSRAHMSVRAPIPAPAVPSASAGPVFSWRAFAADQAIAIMAYLGGFLALVATLTLVVSKGANLPTLTLSIVSLVYLSFGAAGFSLRGIKRLRTVSRVYLAVFALMTPLVALAIYRYGLQSLNFPVAGMLCISAVYASIVYLGLAVQTRFATYAYLGWTSLIVAALSILPWIHADLQWWVFTLGVTTLVLIAPFYLRHIPFVTLLVEPAMHLAALATLPTVMGVQVFGTIALTQLVDHAAFSTIWIVGGALALGACVLVPITAGWRYTVPAWRPRQQDAVIDTVDGFNSVFFAEAVVGVAIWIVTNQNVQTNRPIAVVLAATALTEFGLALMLYLRQRQRRVLRYFLETLAVGLASAGAFIVLGERDPNWPLIIALSAALVITTGAALINGAWWLLASGFFLTLWYYALAPALLSTDYVAVHRAGFSFVLTLVLWIAALVAGLHARSRRFVVPFYMVALGNALFTCLLLPSHDALYQTEIMLTFTAASFSAGLFEQEPLFGNMATGFFGVLAAIPFMVNDANSLHGCFLAVGLALAALGVRRAWGRVWALAPYVIALWAVVIAASHTSFDPLSSPDWSASGLSFTAWFLLGFAALMYGVALWEGKSLVTIVPAALAFWALFLVPSDVASVLLVFALIAGGAAARQWRGRGWGAALQAAATASSVTVTIQLTNLGPDAPNWQVAFLLALAGAAYLVAIQEREPLLSALAVVYLLAATALLPEPDHLLSTLVLTFLLAAFGAIARLPPLRERVRRTWAYAPYAAAIGASIFAWQRVVPFGAGKMELLLLVFAAVAYLLVVLEREPLAASVPLFYALASVGVQPDAHARLTLALGFGALGLLVGRVVGIRWSWLFYAVASFAAATTTLSSINAAGFEAVALLLLAALAYLIAAVESRPDVLAVALALGALALGAETSALDLPMWAGSLAFAALGWLYALGALLWRAIPWLRPRTIGWWTSRPDQMQPTRWRYPAVTGILIHLAGGLLMTTGAALAALSAPNGFKIQDPETLTAALTLLALAGMLALLAWRARSQLALLAQQPWFHLALYLAGELAALAITWGARWLGADNPQAFVLAPGSYQLLVGAFLPADRQVPHARRIGQFASLAGALLLLLPTLYQTFTEPGLTAQLIYGFIVLAESLIIIGLGVGTRLRLLILVGSAFVGIDALSSASLAIRSGVNIALVVFMLALMLIVTATWLSLHRSDTG